MYRTGGLAAIVVGAMITLYRLYIARQDKQDEANRALTQQFIDFLKAQNLETNETNKAMIAEFKTLREALTEQQKTLEKIVVGVFDHDENPKKGR